MGRVDLFSDAMLRTIRSKLHKYGVTLVKNRKTGVVFLRRLTTHPTPPLTERQTSNIRNFTERSHRASQWIKDNNPEACPPDGTPEYQNIMRSFKRQHYYKLFHNFVMSKIATGVIE